MVPSDIPIADYTHIFFAFAYIDPDTYEMADMASDVGALYDDVTALKDDKPSLEVWISIGGWTFNDNDTTTQPVFSDLAASTDYQSSFFSSLTSFMEDHDFDGVDIDWEYPVAGDRSGSDEDLDNYPTFLQNLRSAFDDAGHEGYGLSITLPSSYYYMQNFDIVSISSAVDFFNVMTYDLHGTWDATDGLGSIVQSHTNLSIWVLAFMVEALLSVIRHALHPVVDSLQGRLLDLERQPLDFSTTTFDSDAAAMYAVFDTDQWVSYDNNETLSLKTDYANSLCLGGTLVWAVSLDDSTTSLSNTLGNLTGQSADGGGLVDKEPTGDGGSLTSTSSCEDLESYQTKWDVDLNSAMWDLVDAATYFQSWLSDNADDASSDMASAFAKPWGMKQNFICDAVTNSCDRPDCSDMEDPSADYSGAAYMIMVSITNLSQYWAKMYSALSMSQSQFATLQQSLLTLFYPNNTPDDTTFDEIMNGLTTAMGIIPKFGGDAGSVANTLISGASTGMQKILTSVDETLEKLAELEAAENTYYVAALSQIDYANIGLIDESTYNGTDIDDLFDEGEWVDYTALPVLNDDTSKTKITTTELNAYYFEIMVAGVANWSWKKQNCYVISLAMTKDEFNDLDSGVAEDDNLKLYRDGRGLYFQWYRTHPRSSSTINPPSTDPGWELFYPPGYDDVNDGTYSFTMQDVLKSVTGGYNYTPDAHLSTYLADTATEQLSLFDLGVFNMPHCRLGDSFELSAFKTLIKQDVGTEYTGTTSDRSSACYCMDLEDGNGVSFSDMVDMEALEEINCGSDCTYICTALNVCTCE
ncbi:MAG: hypothetical protein M1834_007498 [Cirrosporium novae-zelandiae]|nr:MAG: hypothetical protein M1834_007498 [Cirrosporium novae-zelandiae]